MCRPNWRNCRVSFTSPGMWKKATAKVLMRSLKHEWWFTFRSMIRRQLYWTIASITPWSTPRSADMVLTILHHIKWRAIARNKNTTKYMKFINIRRRNDKHSIQRLKCSTVTIASISARKKYRNIYISIVCYSYWFEITRQATSVSEFLTIKWQVFPICCAIK